MINIKIYGERNTGTNYLSRLLELNFECNLFRGSVPIMLDRFIRRLPFSESLRDKYFNLAKSNLGWKHREIDSKLLCDLKSTSLNVNYITITKNPYSWLLSLYNRPYNYSNKSHNLSFIEFLQTEFKTFKRESVSNSYLNPIDMWNIKNRSYIALNNTHKVQMITYESLILDPIMKLRELQLAFNLVTKESYPLNFLNSTKDNNKTYEFYLEYYSKEMWKEKLTTNSINLINQKLDYSVLEYFNYSLI